MPEEASPLILLVDDDVIFRERMARALSDRGFEVMTAGDYDQAVKAATEQSPEFAVVDLRMPGRSGLELIKALKTNDSETRIVVLTGYGSIATAVEAVRLGAADYITKPTDAERLVAAFTDTPGDLSREFTAPSLARAEWEHIQRVLLDCAGNVSETAKRLKIHRRSLQRKLKRAPAPDE